MYSLKVKKDTDNPKIFILVFLKLGDLATYDTRGVVETDEVHNADNSPVLVGIYGVFVTTEEDARVSNCQVDSITTRVV